MGGALARPTAASGRFGAEEANKRRFIAGHLAAAGSLAWYCWRPSSPPRITAMCPPPPPPPPRRSLLLLFFLCAAVEFALIGVGLRGEERTQWARAGAGHRVCWSAQLLRVHRLRQFFQCEAWRWRGGAACPLRLPAPGLASAGGPMEVHKRRAAVPLVYIEALLWLLLLGFTIFATYVVSTPSIGEGCWDSNPCAQPGEAYVIKDYRSCLMPNGTSTCRQPASAASAPAALGIAAAAACLCSSATNPRATPSTAQSWATSACCFYTMCPLRLSLGCRCASPLPGLRGSLQGAAAVLILLRHVAGLWGRLPRQHRALPGSAAKGRRHSTAARHGSR